MSEQRGESEAGVMEQHERMLDSAFYREGAEELRASLQLRNEEVAARDAISQATGISDAKILAELAGLGIRVETLAAITLLPLIEVAWADGEMDEREREAVLDAAVTTGIERGSTSYKLLELWMIDQPPPDLANAWMGLIRALRAELGDAKAARMQLNLMGRARDVAISAGSALDRSPHISREEEECLGQLESVFRD